MTHKVKTWGRLHAAALTSSFASRCSLSGATPSWSRIPATLPAGTQHDMLQLQYLNDPSGLAETTSIERLTAGDKTIIVADGTYNLTQLLQIDSPNITVRTQSGVRENVMIQADEMSATALKATPPYI